MPLLSLPMWQAKLLHPFWYGHYAVDMFIVLSGFCLAMPVVRGDGQIAGGAFKFFGKRARRILPTYYLACAFSLLLIWVAIGHKTGTHWDVSLPVGRKSILTHLLLIQDLINGYAGSINHAFWSISVEWRIYFLFPIFMALRRWRGALWMTVIASVGAYAIIFVWHHTRLSSVDFISLDTSSPQYIALFAMGILGADISYGKKSQFPMLRRSAPILTLLATTTLLMIAVSKLKLWHGDVLSFLYADFFVGLWAASLLVAASNVQITWLDRMLSWRPLVFMGTFAYSIYLIHAPLLQVLWQYVFVPLQGRPVPMFLALSLVGTPLIIGVSYLFFLACERPFLNRRKREAMAETERDAALSPAP